MSDIRFNQWLHNSGTGGVSQVDGGHVGIGTTNPLIPVGAGNTSILNVGVVTANSYYGSGANLTGIDVTKIITGNTQVETIDTGSDGHVKITTEGTERLRITSGGDFGTNGVTPTTQAGRVFHLHAGSDQQRFHMTNSTTGSGATDGFEILIDQESNPNCRIRNFEAGYMAFDTGGSNNEVMRLDSSGRVMIGTTAASTLASTDDLTISTSGSTGITLFSAAGNAGNITFGDGTSGDDRQRGLLQYHHSDNSMRFFTNAAERVRITSGGHISQGGGAEPSSTNGAIGLKHGIKSSANNVIIGETTSSSSGHGLHLESRQTGRSGNARIAQIGMKNDASGNGQISFFTSASGADVSERMVIASSNNIRSYATFVDTSYHANPDPFGDGSGVAYYRMNYNFHDSGFFAKHGTSSDASSAAGQPHFSLVNSSGEPCWDNPNEGAINVPNLKDSYPFSMAAWINLSEWSTSANNDVIMNLSISNTRVTLCMCTWSSATSDGMDFYIMYGGQGHHYFRPSSKPTNTWIHVVYSVVGADNTSHRVYQNGSDLTTRGNRGGGHGGSAGWRLGGNANGSERFAIGRIGSIRFFNKALSASEANALYTNDTFYT